MCFFYLEHYESIRLAQQYTGLLFTSAGIASTHNACTAVWGEPKAASSCANLLQEHGAKATTTLLKFNWIIQK
jgi:hypothetical protein